MALWPLVMGPHIPRVQWHRAPLPTPSSGLPASPLVRAGRWRNGYKLLSWNCELDGCHRNVAGSLGAGPGRGLAGLVTSKGMRSFISGCQSLSVQRG